MGFQAGRQGLRVSYSRARRGIRKSAAGMSISTALPITVPKAAPIKPISGKPSKPKMSTQLATTFTTLPSSAATIGTTGLCMQAEEPGRARPFAERAVFLDPNSAAARINLGSIYAALNEHRRAVDEYQQAAELVDPISPELLVNLAESLRALGEDSQVINVLDQLLRTNESALAWERRGAAMFRLGDYNGAATSFERAIEIDAQHYPAFNGLAVLRLNQFLESNNTDTTALQQALDNFRKSLQIEPRQPRARELLSRFG